MNIKRTNEQNIHLESTAINIKISHCVTKYFAKYSKFKNYYEIFLDERVAVWMDWECDYKNIIPLIVSLRVCNYIV